MTKRQVVKEIRDVMVGTSAYECIGVNKLAKGWEVYTSNNDPHMDMCFHHCCNEMTLKEAEMWLNEKMK